MADENVKVEETVETPVAEETPAAEAKTEKKKPDVDLNKIKDKVFGVGEIISNMFAKQKKFGRWAIVGFMLLVTFLDGLGGIIMGLFFSVITFFAMLGMVDVPAKEDKKEE